MDLTTLPGYVAGFPDTLSLRELGGIPTADKRHVRHGLFYRGSSLVELSDEQKDLIDAFGLRFLLDLRAMGEVEGKPDYVPEGCTYVRIAGMYTPDGREVDFSPAGISLMQSLIEESGPTFMKGQYAAMMFGNRALHELVHRFVTGDVPLYFHCTAGKDRTGVCAALLLMLLGVSDGIIVQEFLLTNEYRSAIINMTPDQMPPDIDLDRRKRWALINGVQEENLRACFETVDERYPTRGAYFADEFGLDEATLAQLRDRYLE